MIRLLVVAPAVVGLMKTSPGSSAECSTLKRVGAPTATDLTASGRRIVVVKKGWRWTSVTVLAEIGRSTIAGSTCCGPPSLGLVCCAQDEPTAAAKKMRLAITNR